MQVTTFQFADDGDIPNHPRYPLIAYRGVTDPAAGDPAADFEALFHGHGWRWTWRNGIFPFHHYHANNHEVLGIAGGAAEVRFGGDGGTTVAVQAGDAVLIPAGVGHKRLSADPGLLVIGGYPTSVPVDLYREGAEDRDGIRQRIAAVARPGADPVTGDGGPMAEHWAD